MGFTMRQCHQMELLVTLEKDLLEQLVTFAATCSDIGGRWLQYVTFDIPGGSFNLKHDEVIIFARLSSASTSSLGEVPKCSTHMGRQVPFRPRVLCVCFFMFIYSQVSSQCLFRCRRQASAEHRFASDSHSQVDQTYHGISGPQIQTSGQRHKGSHGDARCIFYNSSKRRDTRSVASKDGTKISPALPNAET